MALAHFEIDGIHGFGDVIEMQPQLEIAKRFKDLVLSELPNSEKFLLGKGMDSHFLQCYVNDVSLTLFAMNDGMLRYHCTYSDLERLKAWMIIGGFCVDFAQLTDDMKAVKECLQRRNYISA